MTLHLGRQARTLDPPNKRVTDDQGTVYLDLPKGIPSHDTFERVFDALDPQAFQQCLLSWLHALSGTASLQQVAIDGKVLRGLGQGGPLGPLHLVNAWATEQSLHLGQVAVDSDSNEITAVPKLLELCGLNADLRRIAFRPLGESRQPGSLEWLAQTVSCSSSAGGSSTARGGLRNSELTTGIRSSRQRFPGCPSTAPCPRCSPVNP